MPRDVVARQLGEITAAEVLGWFRECGKKSWPVPAADSPLLLELVALLNGYRNGGWPPVKSPFDQVKTAIGVLLDDLPPLIEGARRSKTCGSVWIMPVDPAGALSKLLEAAESAQGAFYWPLPPRVGRKAPPWHSKARMIALHADCLWRARPASPGTRVPRVGLSPNGPLVAFVRIALARTGAHHEGEAIYKVLQKRRAQN